MLWIAAGTLFLGLGILGIFLPGLPTTPFLLLTASCYIRGSDRLYKRLISHPRLGKYITEWQRTRGLPKKVKVRSLLLMWLMITLSVLFLIETWIPRIILLLVGLIGTAVMGFIIPTTGRNPNSNPR
ncbi:MAG: YbaN family protein [Bacteroidales bacterium]